MENKVNLYDHMRIIEDFPAEGISYKDITTILQDKDALKASIDQLSEAVKDLDYDYFVAIEARGFIFASALAYANDKGFLMVRKPGKLPGNLIQQNYSLEYGEATIELDIDSVPKGAKVIIVDDLLATGGTAKAACDLMKKAEAEIASVLFLTELTELGGRQILEEEGHKVISVLKYDH